MSGTLLLEWSDSFNTGIAEVDDQHRTLVDLLNRLDRAIKEQRSAAESRKILDELTDYTINHFNLEEGMMLRSQYPGFAEHRRQHAELVAQVQALQHKLDAGQGAIDFELMHFLRVWLTRHISESDKRFGSFLSQPGQAGAGRPRSPAGREPAPAAKPRWKFW